MLVIGRKEGERIKLSNDVVITVTQIAHGKVRIGIDAPESIKVRRSEPCKVCGCATFEYYLDYRDLPFCSSPRCEAILKADYGDRI